VASSDLLYKLFFSTNLEDVLWYTLAFVFPLFLERRLLLPAQTGFPFVLGGGAPPFHNPSLLSPPFVVVLDLPFLKKLFFFFTRRTGTQLRLSSSKLMTGSSPDPSPVGTFHGIPEGVLFRMKKLVNLPLSSSSISPPTDPFTTRDLDSAFPPQTRM